MSQIDQLVRDHWQAAGSVKVQRYLAAAANYGRSSAVAAEDALFLDSYVAPRYRGCTVLDFGAGPGRLVPLWRAHDVHLTSADWSEAFYPALQKTSTSHGAEAVRLDITREALARRFDLVFSTQVMLHIHPRHIDAAMANARAMARHRIMLVTWQGDAAFDTEASTKHHSFNHDYRSLFERHACDIELELELVFRPTRKRGEVRNKIYVAVPRDASSRVSDAGETCAEHEPLVALGAAHDECPQRVADLPGRNEP